MKIKNGQRTAPICYKGNLTYKKLEILIWMFLIMEKVIFG